LDIDEKGEGMLVQARLYQLVRQRRPIVDRTFEFYSSPYACSLAATARQRPGRVCS
jgi:hypothetical protein